ncbi:MAG: hypothetical protein AAF298_07475, partial [Cyanobacteria bacterium P01_A01_bin.40]
LMNGVFYLYGTELIGLSSLMKKLIGSSYRIINANHSPFLPPFFSFTRQTNAIGTGNIIANTQYGSYVRSRFDTECNRFQFAEGHLQQYDLRKFARSFRLNCSIAEIVKQAADKFNGVILYAFFHYQRRQKIINGFVLTKTHRDNHKYITSFVTHPQFNKAHGIISTVRQYISNDYPEATNQGKD